MRGAARRSPAARRRYLTVALGSVAVASLVAGAVVGSGGNDSALRLARRFAAAWARGDYAEMYSTVDPNTQRQLSPASFAAAYRRTGATATAASLRFGAAHDAGHGTVALRARVSTRVFGTIAATLRVPISGTGANERVRWSRALLFPGLRAGESLRRSSSLPDRASLLTRDGKVLATGMPGAGGQRGSRLGAAATAITGTLGSIPKADRFFYDAAGYPAGALVGQSGLERAFEARLAGAPGGELLAGARVLATARSRPAPPVRTTISSRIQSAAVAALGGRDGAVAVLRPKTGEILGLAGVPLSGLQPPGSTFKMVTVTGVLEAHLATPRTQFPMRTAATLSGVSLQNANGESCGGTLAQAFAQSCNSVFAPLGARLGAGRLVDIARRFGFGEPPGIPGAATSTIPPPNQIPDELAAGSTAIGQGEVQATALEMAIVAATIGDTGSRPRPTLAAGTVRPPATVTSPSVARTVEHLMLDVVRNGTGTAAAIPGVRVAGKTGTAELRQTVCPQNQQNSSACAPNPKNTDAWFAAFAPAGHPRVAVGVLLVGAGAGGDTAAPVAHDVLVAALH